MYMDVWELESCHIQIGNPLQCSCMENPMDGGSWWAAVHGVAKSRTWLNNFTFTFHSHALEKDMATQSSVLAWRIPETGEPVGLPSMGSHRVGHDWSDSAAAAARTNKHNPKYMFHTRYRQDSNSIKLKLHFQSYFLLQGIFLTLELNCVSCIGRQILYHWATRGINYLYTTIFLLLVLPALDLTFCFFITTFKEWKENKAERQSR